MEDGEFAQSLSDLLFEKVALRYAAGIRLASRGVVGRMQMAAGLRPTQTCYSPQQYGDTVLLGQNLGCWAIREGQGTNLGLLDTFSFP